VILAGRYEGIDERLIARCVDEEIAIGDFVVSGGELPALMLIDAIARLLPGALNDEQSAREESFADGCSTVRTTRGRRCTKAWRCPTCCCRGITQQIRRWRLMQSLRRTQERRPDLLAGRKLTKEEAALLGRNDN
jgi:tRNA (guanine37-N1)-methyltransferase